MSEKLLLVPISFGELVDKITILQIKLKHFKNAGKRLNTQTELTLLLETAAQNNIDLGHSLVDDLRSVNQRLWTIEDEIRVEEKLGRFGDNFIKLARAVYFENDTRALLKKQINTHYGSKLVEEKEYVDYKAR